MQGKLGVDAMDSQENTKLTANQNHLTPKKSRARLIQNLNRWDDFLQRIEVGEKPTLDLNNPFDAAFLGQLQNMYDRGFLAEPPTSYILDQDENALDTQEKEERIRRKGLTPIEPIPKNVTTAGKEMRKSLKKDKIGNFVILGEDPHAAYVSSTAKESQDKSDDPAIKQLSNADIFILTSSGMAGLHQYVRYLQENMPDFGRRALPLKSKHLIKGRQKNRPEFSAAASNLSTAPKDNLRENIRRNLGLTSGKNTAENLWLNLWRDRLDEKEFILHNIEDFWGPFLKQFSDLINPLENFEVFETRHQIGEHIKRHLPTQIYQEPTKKLSTLKDNLSVIHDGKPFPVALVTTNSKKSLQHGRAINFSNSGAIAIPYNAALGHSPEGSKELSYSYTGNVMEKLQAFLDMLEEQIEKKGAENVLHDPAMEEHYQKQEIDPERLILQFDDSGFDLDPRYFGGPEFAGLTSDIRSNSVRQYLPGPEAKGMIEAARNVPYEAPDGMKYGGEAGFVLRIEAAHARLVEKGIIPPGSPILVRQKSCLITASYASLIKEVGKRKNSGEPISAIDFIRDNIVAFTQSTVDNHMITPQNLNQKSDWEDCLYPLGNSRQQSQNEDADFLDKFGVFAQHWKAVKRHLGIDHVHDDTHTPTRDWTKVKLKGVICDQFNFHASGKDPKNLQKEYKIETRDGGTIKVRSFLMRFEEFCQKSDLFYVLDGHKWTKRIQRHFAQKQDSPTILDRIFNCGKVKAGQFWQDLFTGTSIIVGKQLNDPSVAGKGVVWKKGPIFKIVDSLSGSTIKERLNDFIDFVGSKIKKKYLVRAFKKAYAENIPLAPVKQTYHVEGQEADKKLFRVTVYCSACSTNQTEKKKARELGLSLAAMGYAVKTGGGGGPDGLMFEVNQGVRDAIEKYYSYLKGPLEVRDGDMPESHLTCHYTNETFQEEGEFKGADLQEILPNIYLRMEKLQDTDAEVVLSGGAGTLQEIAGSILLREMGVTEIINRPLIIVNKNEIYDTFLESIPKGDRDRYNIHVVTSEDQALPILKEARKAAGKDPKSSLCNIENFTENLAKLQNATGYNFGAPAANDDEDLRHDESSPIPAICA